ncbi:MAG: NYN domain-containing protein [Halodesulfurarchaeum sp.]
MGWLSRHLDSTDRVGLFVDGPNVLREEFDVDLDELRETAGERGTLGLTRLYLDEKASAGLIQAGEAHGFDVRITSGDVDVKLAVDATAAIQAADLDLLAIATRDIDFKPVVELANEAGIGTLAIAPGSHGRSDALVAAADDAVVLD